MKILLLCALLCVAPVRAPGFRPNLPVDDGSDIEPVFDYVLRYAKLDIARAMMATPDWTRTNWSARNTARPLILASYAPKSEIENWRRSCAREI